MPKLTPNEAALLRLLQAHRGEAVPRARLLAGVGWPPDIRTRTLDVHIQHLRSHGFPLVISCRDQRRAAVDTVHIASDIWVTA